MWVKKIIYLLFMVTTSMSAAILDNKHQQSGFVENKGQFKNQNQIVNTEVFYRLNAKEFSLSIKKNGYSVQFQKLNLKNQVQFERVDVNFKNSNNPEIIPQEELFINSYYYQSGSLIQAKVFNKLLIKNIYPKIDLVFYVVNQSSVKYDYILHAGADINDIEHELLGYYTAEVDDQGNTKIKTTLGEFTEACPVIYDQSGNKLQGEFRINKQGVGKFSSKTKYSKNQKIIIDPTITWSTYFGSDSIEVAYDINASGTDLFLSGKTSSIVNVATTGVHQGTYGGGGYDAFISKHLKASGNRVWTTYFGGEGENVAKGCYADAMKIYVCGYTDNDSIFIDSNAYQPQYGGGNYDAFVASFHRNNGALDWSTFFGGDSMDMARSIIAVDTLITFVGVTSSPNQISYNTAHQDSLIGMKDAFLASFSKTGTPVWSTYHGGTLDDEFNDLVLTEDSFVVVVGTTYSLDSGYIAFIDSIYAIDSIYNGLVLDTVIIHTPYRDTLLGNSDVMLAKYKLNGYPVLGTYFGGNHEDQGETIDSDDCGNFAFGGLTYSDSLLKGGGFWGYQYEYEGSGDGFFAKMNKFSELKIVSYVGGDSLDVVTCIDLTPKQNYIVIGGYTKSDSLTSSGLQNNYRGEEDGFMIDLNSYGNVRKAIYFGDTLSDKIYGLTYGNPYYLCGSTASIDSIALNANQDTLAGQIDAFLFKAFVSPRLIFAPECGDFIPFDPSDLCFDSYPVTLGFLPPIFDDQDLNNYFWTFSGGSPSTSTLPSPAITFFTPGTYSLTLTVSNPDGSMTFNATFELGLNPTLTVTASDYEICEGECVTLYANSNGTISWPGGGGPDSLVVCPTTTTTYYFSSCLGNCCKSDQVTIIVHPKPILYPDDTIICIGSQVQLETLGSGALNFQWIPDTYLDNPYIQNPICTPDSTIFYSIVGTSGYGCKDTTNYLVEVLYFPVINSGSSSPGFCADSCIILWANSGDQVYWPDLGLYQDTIITCPDSSFTYNIVAFNSACISNDSITIIHYPPSIISASTDTLVCAGLPVSISAQGATNYIWQPPLYLNDSSLQSPVSTPLGDITYTVYGANQFGCIDTEQVTIKIKRDFPINADFTYEIDSCLFEVHFKPTIINGLTYQWDFGDGFSLDQYPSHVFPANGETYIITVTTSVASICSNYAPIKDSTIKELPFEINFSKLYFPNVFSPNDDSYNSFFEPQFSYGCRNYHLQIYDRWGLRMLDKTFYHSDSERGWNGRVNNTGDNVPDGTYYYIVSLIDPNGKLLKNYNGHVTLVR